MSWDRRSLSYAEPPNPTLGRAGLALALAGVVGCVHGSSPATAGQEAGLQRSRTHQFTVPSQEAGISAAAMVQLARELLADDTRRDGRQGLLDRLQLELTAGETRAALTTLGKLRAQPMTTGQGAARASLIYGIYAEALLRAGEDTERFGTEYGHVFSEAFSRLDDREAFQVAWDLGTPTFVYARRLQAAFGRVSAASEIDRDDAVALVSAWLAQRVREAVAPYTHGLIEADQARRYVIDDSVLIGTPDSATLSATLVRPRGERPQPTALAFTIYADETVAREMAVTAASHGYVGIVADARGKRLSRDSIRPYESEVDDAYAVIDWISRQPWSNGDVAMYGGSYLGFAAWAAAKRLHPALKTIVTYAAAIPGQGLPMRNNVFLNANYAWAFFVTNNRTLDNETYSDQARWDALLQRWYASGRPYREIDQVDGTPNPWLQRWLDHPAYDAFWQAMVPYGQDYADIDIPILSLTGYYDDAQISVLQYLRQHYRYRPDAEHYLVIGPYDHFGVQGFRKPVELRGYRIDSVAQFDTRALTFQWLDYVLRDGERPALVRDRINYQVMGANRWRHAASIEAMASETVRLYLTPATGGEYHLLSSKRPAAAAVLEQVVDLADRSLEHNLYYPNPIQGRTPDFSTGFMFVSEPFEAPVEVSGLFSGQLTIAINKRDVDLGVTLYEVLSDGTLFHLSYFLGRASYAGDPTTRRRLRPGEVSHVDFETMLVSRRVEAGSRLLVTVDVNRNRWHQINYGTGGDVSNESVADAGEPLVVLWHNGSYVDLPIAREE